MIEAGICGLLKAKHIVENKMLPLVGDRQRVYEENLETMEVWPNQFHLSYLCLKRYSRGFFF